MPNQRKNQPSNNESPHYKQHSNMPKQYSVEEMQKQIHQLQTTINLPGVPDDEKAIYAATITRIQSEINNRKAAPAHLPAEIRQPAERAGAEPIKHNAPPPPPPVVIQSEAKQPYKPHTTTQTKPEAHTPHHGGEGGGLTTRTIHAGHQHPVNSQTPLTATIEADHDADPYNPRIRITWADGYTFTGDETSIRGRLITTLRDTCALRLVQKGRLSAMWRWSSPWRAAGFLQAIIALRHGEVPTLRDLDVKRPSDLTTTVFTHITEKALQTTTIL